MPEVSLLPSGELEGLPCVSVVLHQIGAPEDLVRHWTQASRTGTRVLRVQAPNWGDPALDDALTYFSSHPETSSVTVWANRPVDAEHWANAAELWWSVDIAPLLCMPRNQRTLVEEMASMPFIPQPTELTWRAGEADYVNLNVALLDEIVGRLDPERGGWIYLDREASPALREQAMNCAAGCSTSWGVRFCGA